MTNGTNLPLTSISPSNVKVASIGPVTSEQLKNLGVRVDAEAAVHTIDGLLDVVKQTRK